MNNAPTPRNLSTLLQDFRDEMPPERVRVDEVLEAFHERGLGIILFIFSLPAAAPIPAPGINTLIAIPLLVLTVQMAIGRHTVWFPAFIRKQSLSRDLCERMIDVSLPWIVRLEKFTKPRLGFVTQGLFSKLIGVFGFIMALSGAVPLPLMNTVPAIGISLMAIGVIMRDGLIVLSGCVLGIVWVFLITAIYLTLGTEGIHLILSYFRI
jgi:hypothetical protein